MTGKRRLDEGGDATPPRGSVTPTPVPPSVGPRRARRVLQESQRRDKRRRFGVLGLVVAVLVVVAAVVGITIGVRHETANHKTEPKGPTTVLLSLADANGVAVESALLAHDSATNHGVELLLPGQVLIDVCGFGSQPLSHVLSLPDGQQLSQRAVSDMLGGVSVDGSWQLTTEQLTQLVDAVGGVTVDVDTDVIQTKPDGSRVLVVSQGPGQHLGGTKAVAFATYFQNDGDAAGNLVRLQSVIDGLLAALPQDQAGVVKLLTSLGKGGGSTLGADRLASVLVGLAADARANSLLPAELPVVKHEAGHGAASYSVDTEQTAQFVHSNLAASLPSGAQQARTRVFVQNGVGTPGLSGSACKKLVAAGFAFAGSGNAGHFGYATSKVLVFDHSVRSAQTGNAVARALGLPGKDVNVSDQGQNVADVIVILGRDFKP